MISWITPVSYQLRANARASDQLRASRATGIQSTADLHLHANPQQSPAFFFFVRWECIMNHNTSPRLYYMGPAFMREAVRM